MRSLSESEYKEVASLLLADPHHRHIHITDMPYRIASIWQDHGCEFRLWEQADQVLAWAVFQPAWWNLDYAVHPSLRGSEIEQEIFGWGIDQMVRYSRLTGETFWGSVEIFEDTPNLAQTIGNLEAVGFRPFEWSIIRFELDLTKELSPVRLPDGYRIRPLRGEHEVQAYVALHQAAFGSKKMTVDWRRRILKHPAYRPELDLIVENAENISIGFCICWQHQDSGQIEPLGIHPDHQGRGLGEALEIFAYRAMLQSGVRLAKIDHASFNQKAIGLSQKTGFRQTNNALRYYFEIK